MVVTPATARAALASGQERRSAFGFWVPEAELEDPQRIAFMLEELTLRDVGWLLEHPEAPALYASGIRYQAQPLGRERWKTVPECLRMPWWCDCKCFATWRAAELRVAGEPSAFAYTDEPYRTPDLVLYHVLVRRADGRTEDPSRLLGMP